MICVYFLVISSGVDQDRFAGKGALHFQGREEEGGLQQEHGCLQQERGLH